MNIRFRIWRHKSVFMVSKFFSSWFFFFYIVFFFSVPYHRSPQVKRQKMVVEWIFWVYLLNELFYHMHVTVGNFGGIPANKLSNYEINVFQNDRYFLQLNTVLPWTVYENISWILKVIFTHQWSWKSDVKNPSANTLYCNRYIVSPALGQVNTLLIHHFCGLYTLTCFW